MEQIYGNRSCLVAVDERSSDARGYIKSICDLSVENVSVIKCEASSIRSNHLHKTDSHLMYVVSGKIDYFYEFNEVLYYFPVLPGQLVFTPPQEWHATVFPETSLIIAISHFGRTPSAYERDTERKTIISTDNYPAMLELAIKDV